MKRSLLLIIACLTAGACANTEDNHILYLKKRGITATTSENFQQCFGYGCKRITEVQLSKKEWKPVDRLFRPAPKTPEAERKAIARAIGVLEDIVGARTGTHVDQYGTFRKTGYYQLDCVDESTNTTIYLELLKTREHLNHHKVEAPTSRLPILHAGRWPHQTAVMSELDTGVFYAVDSWFHDNGFEAEIVPLREWKQGWKPEQSHRHGDSSDKD